jgi:hypothetical protein
MKLLNSSEENFCNFFMSKKFQNFFAFSTFLEGHKSGYYLAFIVDWQLYCLNAMSALREEVKTKLFKNNCLSVLPEFKKLNHQCHTEMNFMHFAGHVTNNLEQSTEFLHYSVVNGNLLVKAKSIMNETQTL